MNSVVSSTATPSFFIFCDHFHKSCASTQIRFTHLQHKSNPLTMTALSSSSSSSSVVEEEEEELDSDALPFNGCKGCGREEMESGCNSEGRIQGGIATIPGFGWWPIKAYRPCPGFLASGGNYRRRGQSMDEVAFGGGSRRKPAAAFDDTTETRKKGNKQSDSKS